MKKYKSIGKLLAVSFLTAAIASACTEDAMDKINENPNNPLDAPAKFLITDLGVNTGFSTVGGDFSLYSSVYIEHETGISNQLYRAEVRSGEPTTATTYNNAWINVYANIKNAKIVIKKCEEDPSEKGNVVTEAIAKILLAYNGAVEADKGKCKTDVFNEHLKRKRVASAEELNLMLMRSTRPQQVTRRGVHLDIGGGRIDFWNDDFVHLMLGKKVYFRYDPENLSEVRIYDLEDRYIMSVPADNTAVLSYNASKDDVKAAMAKTRRLERIAREYKENAILADVDKITAMELVLKQAERNKANYQGKPNPSLLEVQRADEEPVFKKVVGGADLDVMNRNAAIRRGGK